MNNVKIIDFAVGNINLDQISFYETSVLSGKNSVIQNLSSNKLHKNQITTKPIVKNMYLFQILLKLTLKELNMKFFKEQ